MRRPGITLMEVMLVVALMAIMFSMTFPLLNSFRKTQTLRTISQDVFRTLVLARHRAQTNERGMGWGVQILNGSYVLYAGDSYATRSAALDGSHAVSGEFRFSGLTDIPFQKSTGKPVYTGTVTITHTAGRAMTITVNSAGGLKIE